MAFAALALAAGAVMASAASEPSGRQTMVQTSGKPSPRKPGAVNADDLLALFPGTLAGWAQTQLGKPLPPRVPGPTPAVRAEYSSGEQTARISVSTGVLPAIASQGSPRVTRRSRADGHDAVVTVSLANGVQISATSATADAPALEEMLRGLDLARFESLKPARR
jgi:hypothetical protein